MEKYKIKPTDEKIFANLVEGMNCSEEDLKNFRKCAVKEVVLVPEIQRCIIFLQTTEKLNDQLLQNAEIFLSEKYNFNAQIKEKVLIPVTAEKNSPSPKVSQTKKSPSSTKTEKVRGNGKKIVGEVINISEIETDKNVVVCGEIGEGEKNGINFREFKFSDIGNIFIVEKSMAYKTFFIPLSM